MESTISRYVKYTTNAFLQERRHIELPFNIRKYQPNSIIEIVNQEKEGLTTRSCGTAPNEIHERKDSSTARNYICIVTYLK